MHCLSKNSKTYFAMILLLGFVGVAVFGFATMTQGMSHGGCVASRLGGIDSKCPASLIDYALHHMAAYHSFLSVFASSISWLLLLIIASVLLFSIFFPSVADLFSNLSISRRRRNTEISHRFRDFTYWLSLFEHSPSF